MTLYRSIAVMAVTLIGCQEHQTRISRESPTNLADSEIPVAPADTAWPDPAPHRSGFVFSSGVRIHYLDFGGQGEPMVFLTGLGSSAHIFDDFAPRFTDRFRVVAMTRRGHAESDRPKDGYTLDRLVDDLKAVLDTLGFRRATLVGHSIAGGELTLFANRFPGRVARLIYLDAVLATDGLEQIVAEDTIRVRATENDLASYQSARAWFERCFFGTWSTALEADFRLNTTSSHVTDRILKDAERNPLWRQSYTAIRSPTLVLYTLATLERRRPCVASLPDKERVQRAEAYLRDVFRPYQLARVRRLQREMPHARVIELQGHHFLFISNEDEVVQEMREFLSAPMKPSSADYRLTWYANFTKNPSFTRARRDQLNSASLSIELPYPRKATVPGVGSYEASRSTRSPL
ncbi:MAG TPA: alpha/beta hydrolase [Gemmatimonadales bacterium]|nr:alpha/beta hydrolase [Gemmatimonadales bacterium]